MGIMKNSAGNPIHSCRGLMSVTETTLTAGVSPYVIDVATGLGGGTNRGNRGYIANDGGADMLAEIALEGSNYMTQFTIKNGDNFDITGMNLSKIRLTRSGSDTNFRVVAW